jgi:hypothetical protein
LLYRSNNTTGCYPIIYKTVVKPCVLYLAELWTLTKKVEDALATWERKTLRRIYGPKYINNEWKTRTNEEIMHMFNASDIISTIKSKRMAGPYPKNDKGERC